MTVPAPDPHRVRAASLEQLRRLELPTPPPSYPLVWEPGDTVELRSLSELEGRTAILNVVLARCFGMPGEAAMSWLLDAHLLESLTKPEWSFVASGEGDNRSFALHLEALYALAWLVGLVPHLDPTEPAPDGLVAQLPHLPSKETFAEWRLRTKPPRVRPPRRRSCWTCSTASTGPTLRPSAGASGCPASSTRTRSASAGGPWSGPWCCGARTRPRRVAGKRSICRPDRPIDPKLH